MTKPNNIILIGLMGVGKTSIGRYLAKRLQLNFVDTDQVLEQRTNVTIAQIFAIEGEAKFREREATLIAELSQQEHMVLATGGGAVLRADNRQTLAQRGVVIYLYAPVASIIKRIYGSKRPLLQVDDPSAVLQTLQIQREPLYLEIADLTYETGTGAIYEQGEIIIQDLKKLGYF